MKNSTTLASQPSAQADWSQLVTVVIDGVMADWQSGAVAAARALISSPNGRRRAKGSSEVA